MRVAWTDSTVGHSAVTQVRIKVFTFSITCEMSFPLVSGSLSLGIISRTLRWDAGREGKESITFFGGPILRPTLKIRCLRILQKDWLYVA